MKASEYQVRVPPNLKDFKWDGRGQTSLDWQRSKNKFKDVAKIMGMEQLFEKNSSFDQSRRTINTKRIPHLLKLDAKISC
jgi:hypothetical protein